MTSPRLLVLLLLLAFAGPTASHAAEPTSHDRRMVDTYRGMLVDDPDQDYAFRRLLEVSHSVGGLTGLIALYEGDVARDPKSFASWVLLGRLAAVAENEPRAIAAFEQAAALRPRSASPPLGQAALFRRLRKWDEALAAYDRAVPLIRDLAIKQETLKSAAETAIEADRGERADAYFEQLVKTEPANLFLRMQYAATLARLGQQERALAMWQDVEERARGQLKHLVIVWKEVADLQMALGRLDDAEKTWRRALAKTPPSHWERRTFIDGLIAVHRRQDRLAELIAELEPEAAKSHETLVTVARLYEELADDTKALALYQDALKRRPKDVQTRMAALEILERVGSPEEILAAWRELVRATPGDARHELHLAGLYFQHGKKAEAYDLVQRISAGYPLDPGVHQHVIDLWMRYGDPAMRKRIEGEYKILMRLEPAESGHVVSLGEYYWTVDDKPRARATWKRLLDMGRDRAEGHFLLAEVLADHGLTDDARAEYEKAIAAAPEEQRYARSYALLLERLGRRGDALAVWGRLLDGAAGASRPTTRDARQHIIALWAQTRALSKEIARLEAAFSAEPPDLGAGPFLADAYLYLHQVEDAQRVLERLHRLAPDDVEALVGLEAVYTRQNALDKAIAVLEQLARANSAQAVDYLHRAADLALNLGDTALALRFARQVVELNSVDPQAQIRVGDLYARMGYRPEAAEAWRQAMVLDPRNDTVRFKLAGLYRDMGQPLREEQTLVEVLRTGRDPSDTLRAGRRLLQLAAATERLEVLQDILEPLVLAGSGRGIYLKLLVDVYASRCRQAIHQSRGAAERDATLAAIGERGLRPLLDALADNDVAVRTRALDVLELTHPPGAAPALTRLSQDNDVLARTQAAVALGRVGSQAAVASLSRLANGAKNQERQLALWALGLASGDDAGRALTDRLARAHVRERPLIA
ncbi:MAG: tetratricopeptide repeat protein, partial [Deltaproteobacteria bacterium]